MNFELTLSKRVTISDRGGLRMLTAQRIALLASRFKSTITIGHKRHRANATNILDILVLAAMYGADLNLQAQGEDAELALVEVTRLINADTNPESEARRSITEDDPPTS